MKTQYIILLLIVLYFVLKPSGYVAMNPDYTMFTQAQIQKLLDIPGSDIRHRCAALNYARPLNMKTKAIIRMPHVPFITNYIKPLLLAEQNNTLGKLDSMYMTCLRNNNVSMI